MKSGWLQLLYVIPLVGLILWIIWMVREGDGVTNKYGPSPKLQSGSPEGDTALA